MPITKIQNGKIITIPVKPTKNFPKISEAFKLPLAVGVGSSCITLNLVKIDNSGRHGINIKNAGVLPLAGNDIAWSIAYCWYQGAEPSIKTWFFEKLNLTNNGDFSILIEATPRATYKVFLQAMNNGKPVAFPVASIITPDDEIVLDLESIISDDVLSKNEKPYFKMLYDSVVSEQVFLNNAAAPWIPAINPEKVNYDAAISELTYHRICKNLYRQNRIPI